MGELFKKFLNIEYTEHKFSESFYVRNAFILPSYLRVWLYIKLQNKHAEIRIISSDFRAQYLYYISLQDKFYFIFILLVVFTF